MALTVAKTTKFAVLDVARPARGAAAADAAGTREERRLRWLPEMTAACDISGDGRTLTRVHEFQDGWAAGTSLPTAGISSFDVRIDVSLANEGLITIGVCDAEANYGWGLCLEDGTLDRMFAGSNQYGRCIYHYAPFPENYPAAYPDREYAAQILETPPHRYAEGAVIGVVWDADAGTLAFRVNGGPAHQALAGFPAGAALRPCVLLHHAPGDRVTLLTDGSGEQSAPPVDSPCINR